MDGKIRLLISSRFASVVLLLAVMLLAVGDMQAQGPSYHSYDSLVPELSQLASNHPDITDPDDVTPMPLETAQPRHTHQAKGEPALESAGQR